MKIGEPMRTEIQHAISDAASVAMGHIGATALCESLKRRGFQVVRDWLPIDTAPRGVAIIVDGPAWQSPGEAMIDANGDAYSPVSGDTLMPAPTLWMAFPNRNIE